MHVIWLHKLFECAILNLVVGAHHSIFKLNRRNPVSHDNLLGERFRLDKGHSENQHQLYWIITIYSGLATNNLHRTSVVSVWSLFGFHN